MIRSVIFDMDGVLLDSEPTVTRAAVEALRHFGIEADPSEFRAFTGMGENRFIGGVAELHGGTFVPEMKTLTYEIYGKLAPTSVHVYPWTVPMLAYLTERGIPYAVASAADLTKVRCNLSVIGRTPEDFAAVITGSDVTRHKPAPDCFLKAAELAGFRADECLVAEDALSGIRAAKAAGMSAVGVTTSFSAQALREAGADFVTDELESFFRDLFSHSKADQSIQIE